ncbi:MAG: ATP-binding cassette domain-containing protein [Eubacteriales bacterium]|nr:ATP-binding cassette domain-containing protein [Clostridiales bacterium]MDY5836650.1 ATP-binding cassette domain-containing protein [Eubacteriales bacterium]
MARLKILNLSKYYGNVTALDEISMEFHPGITGIMGNNGAGKSTLLNILASLLQPSFGAVYLDDRDIFDMDAGYRRLLGYMPQQQEAYRGLRVHQFLEYISVLKELPYKTARNRIPILLEQFHLQDQQKKYCEDLSGGMRQRLLLAAALLNDPLVLILDEPTAGLDPIERASLREALIQLPAHTITLLATHIVSDLEFIAQELVFMEKGRIKAQGDQSDLLSACPCFISSLSAEDLRKEDPQLKLVNVSYQHGQKLCRVISHTLTPSAATQRVPAGLDDLYLELLSPQA